MAFVLPRGAVAETWLPLCSALPLRSAGGCFQRVKESQKHIDDDVYYLRGLAFVLAQKG